jgi:hypothetical protein
MATSSSNTRGKTIYAVFFDKKGREFFWKMKDDIFFRLFV